MQKKVLSIAMIIITLACMLTSCFEKEDDTIDGKSKESVYVDAIALLEDGRYAEAYAEFGKLGNYKDTGKYLSKFHYVPLSMKTTAEGYTDPISIITVNYNNRHLPTSATRIEGENTTQRYLYTYDANSNLIKKESFSPGGDKSTYQYDYDVNGRRTRMTHTLPGGDSYSFDYTYDTNGRLIEALYTSDSGDMYTTYTVSYEYDKNGRLLKEINDHTDVGTLREYTYDKNGNLIKSSYGSKDKKETYYTYTSTYDSNNQLTKKVFKEGERQTEFYFTVNEDRTEVEISYEYEMEVEISMLCKYELVYIDQDVSAEELEDILQDIKIFME